MTTSSQSLHLNALLLGLSLPCALASAATAQVPADAPEISVTPSVEAVDLGPIMSVESLAPPALSQSEASAAPADAPEPDLRIRARVGAGYTTDGGSYPAAGYFEGFLPLWQEVGDELGFLEGRLAFNADDTLAGSLLLGYRGYNDNDNRIRGGYIGIDGRDTRFSTFYGLSTGYESLGETWDFRFNAYLPLGDRSRVISDIDTDTGLQTSTRFQGNQLLLETQRLRQRLLQSETVLGGFDAEAGALLSRWDQGDLRGYGGVYLYGAPNLPSYVGWRLRLAANFTPNFSSGLALQSDDLFGTRLVLSVGATFPGVHPEGAVQDEDIRVRSRLGEPTRRRPELGIFYQEESEFFSEFFSQPLMNPEEEEAYRFQHVALGVSGGDGTFENPFGAVQQALDATVGDGNDIVYVDGETDVSIPRFTIPDRVRVLSQGPQQFIAGLPFPGFPSGTARLPFSSELNYADGIIVELPFSGDGRFPQIQDGVVLGNRTVLAGFRIEDATGDGISGSNIRNVELRNNVITNPGRGIALEDVGGSVVLYDNVVVGAQGVGPDSGQGISIRNRTTASAAEITIAGFQADGSRVGIAIEAVGSAVTGEAPNQVIAIGPSSPLNTSVGTLAGTELTNSASDNAETGIQITARDLGSQEITIQAVDVRGNGGDGVAVISGTLGGNLTAFQEVSVRDSAIATNSGNGITIEAYETAAQEFNIDGNEIVGNGGAGISSLASNSSIQEFVAKDEIESLGIGGNTIAENGGDGITISTANADTLLVEASQNVFRGNGGVDLQVGSSNSARTCLVVFDNTGSPSFEVTNASSAIFQVSDRDNLSFNNDGAAVNLAPSAAAFTNIAPRNCL